MLNGKVTMPELAERYTSLVEEALKVNFLVRDSDLQQAKIAELESFRVAIKNIKAQAVDRKQEDVANMLFQFQCVVNSLKCALEMWLKLKGADAQAAWNLLVDAQEYASVAQRIQVQGSWGIPDYSKHLATIEKAVFPHWPLYMSPGIIEDAGECSICGKEYSACQEHLEGFIYWGKLCQRLNRKKFQADHTAFVESPQDKRCIITHISMPDGRKRDYITWKVLDEKFEGAKVDQATLLAQCVILSLAPLDFN